uniref:Uncharacterized protein n=1 Tax=Candidatus Kentrum sp. SD TaxID=2126332 RepID=A0A451BR71_9GAMM|nr:MAG: hypothetical protein BECKSD772D_GA0070982_11463 [Candidatus Kentron sp. SD]
MATNKGLAGSKLPRDGNWIWLRPRAAHKEARASPVGNSTVIHASTPACSGFPRIGPRHSCFQAVPWKEPGASRHRRSSRESGKAPKSQAVPPVGSQSGGNNPGGRERKRARILIWPAWLGPRERAVCLYLDVGGRATRRVAQECRKSGIRQGLKSVHS